MSAINGSYLEGESPDLRFSAVNYVVFGAMLAISTLIGVYFGFISKKKQDTTVEYLLGGKEMSFFPIAASLIASHISGATFLAVPAEVIPV
jgi:solute carrier family 5 (sodium-coupled monocarboxylate transporter), member 8/12